MRTVPSLLKRTRKVYNYLKSYSEYTSKLLDIKLKEIEKHLGEPSNSEYTKLQSDIKLLTDKNELLVYRIEEMYKWIKSLEQIKEDVQYMENKIETFRDISNEIIDFKSANPIDETYYLDLKATSEIESLLGLIFKS